MGINQTEESPLNEIYDDKTFTKKILCKGGKTMLTLILRKFHAHLQNAQKTRRPGNQQRKPPHEILCIDLVVLIIRNNFAYALITVRDSSKGVTCNESP